jgi:cytochrome c oxidase cbb3-type subunit 2
MRPYTPLELAGRNIYIREGCYVCHSQMIRPFRDEVERYGHYSLAAESMYDHPFQWGSKRTGPDLARVGGRYSNEWHVAASDRSALGGAGIDHAELWLPVGHAARLCVDIGPAPVANAASACPTPQEMIANAAADLVAQADPNADTDRLAKRYPKAKVGDFDGNPPRLTEMDALVAYLQMLGTLVDFSTYDEADRLKQ